MASTTTNLGLTKPAYTESADVAVINENSDKIDTEAGKARANLAAEYNASAAYSVGDYCTRGGVLYRCTTAIGSGGETWNSGHWTRVAVTGEIPKVIDNLTTDDAAKALSAKQGKVLKDSIAKYTDSSNVTLNTLTWDESGQGKFYAVMPIPSTITGTIIAVSINYFASLKADDDVVPYINSSGGISLLSNKNSFATNGRIGVRIVWLP